MKQTVPTNVGLWICLHTEEWACNNSYALLVIPEGSTNRYPRREKVCVTHYELIPQTTKTFQRSSIKSRLELAHL